MENKKVEFVNKDQAEIFDAVKNLFNKEGEGEKNNEKR